MNSKRTHESVELATFICIGALILGFVTMSIMEVVEHLLWGIK